MVKKVIRYLESKIWFLTWKYSNNRPDNLNWHYYRPNSLQDKVFEIATKESAQFIYQHMHNIPHKANHYENLAYALSQLNFDNGLYMEFGVYKGDTANFIAKTMKDKTIHCFDSFKGLPVDWTTKDRTSLGSKGSYSTNGKIPKLRNNVKLHIGWFNESFPIFSQKPAHQKPISFMHIDSDLYESAKTILMHFEKQIVPGTTIVLDEFFNYPGYKEHEFKAFFEFIERTKYRYEFISYVDRGYSVAVKIT